MVAKITIGRSIRGILHYNENKILQGQAQCIAANRYGLNVGDMNFEQKLQRFQNIQEHNKRVKTNAVHVSLNFDPSEKVSNALLIEIAARYMEKIGFGNQPYLVYRHNDAGHPHIHVATTNVQSNGQAISLHNIGRERSEPARKELEQEYGLVQAESRSQKKMQNLKPFPLEKLQYGRTETKRAITNIVNTVIRQYNFTSLPEFNAVLNQYNIIADRGNENTRMFKGNGLIYNATDDKGNKLGVGIKASDIYLKPTLKNLEAKFQKNNQSRKIYKELLRERIEKAISNHPKFSLSDFENLLKRQNINVLFRENAEGRIYGVTYIDEYKRSVFNGSDLGKTYSANAINERLVTQDQLPLQKLTIEPRQRQLHVNPDVSEASQSLPLLHNLLQPSRHDQNQTGQLQKKRKRKKKLLQNSRQY